MDRGSGKGRKGLLRGLAVAFLVPVLVLSSGIVVMQRRIYYPLSGSAPVRPPAGWVRASSADRPDLSFWASWNREGAPSAIMFHGNAVTLSDMAGVADAWTAEGWNVVLVEFPGYAGNAGSPSEESIAAAGRSAWDWARAHGATKERTVVVGNSIGTGGAVSLAASAGTAGLLVVSGVDDLAGVVRAQVPFVPSFLVFDRFRSARLAGLYHGRTGVWHSPVDEVVPYSQGEAIARSAGTRVIDGPGGHQLFWNPRTQKELRTSAARMVGMVSPGPVKRH